MFNAWNDQVVPRACATEFADACGTSISWYDANHYTMAKYAPAALKRVARYFSAADWLQPADGKAQ